MMAHLPPALAQAVRLRRNGDAFARLERAADAGARRVIVTCDRLGGEAGDEIEAGSQWSVEEVASLRAATRERGLELGVLLVVGLPGENAERARMRLAALEELRPDRLRCIPFEVAHDHPLAQRLGARGLLPPRGWNREVHEPLRDAGFDREAFTRYWAAALDLQARVALEASVV